MGALSGLLWGPEGFYVGSRAHLGGLLGASWGVLDQHRRYGELLWAVLGVSWSLLAASWCFLGALGKHRETAVTHSKTTVKHFISAY